MLHFTNLKLSTSSTKDNGSLSDNDYDRLLINNIAKSIRESRDNKKKPYMISQK